ncbi:MAG: mechanosensitive ion channel [Saprospiraceae bacterium]|nr:mechanosensitive ion channel [Saprospiraceae bacterium]
MKFILLFSTEIQEAIREMMISMFVAIPRFISAIFVLFFGYIISKMIAKIVRESLKKLNLNKFGEKINNIDFFKANNIEIDLSKILSGTIYYLLMLIFVMVVVGILDMPVLAELMKDIITYVPNLLVAILILIGGILLADTVKSAVLTTCKSLGIPSANIISGFVFYFIFINIIIVSLSQAKINTEFFATNLSIIIGGAVLAFSIGYGLASKDILAGFLASFYSKDKINVGDKITIDGYTGYIIEMDKSSVTIKTDGKKIIIPMIKILKENIEIHQ